MAVEGRASRPPWPRLLREWTQNCSWDAAGHGAWIGSTTWADPSDLVFTALSVRRDHCRVPTLREGYCA